MCPGSPQVIRCMQTSLFGGKRGVRSVENAECRKCGVWKMRSVENAECGKCQYEINKESNSFIFSLKECFIIL